MNPKQDVTAGPPVRVTDRDTGTQEVYCFVLLWERQNEGKGSVGRDGEIGCVCVVMCVVTLLETEDGRASYRNSLLAKFSSVSEKQSQGDVSDISVLH